ncbi:MAG: hypothetical protein V4773_29290 [Verrucomicrobiota bacterium]
MLATAGLSDRIRGEENARAGRFHPTPVSTTYKCIFNHELLIICNKDDNSPAYIGSFIDKLKNTDVDAIMCCPTMWRTNVYPSEVDPQWKKYTPEQRSTKFPSFDRIMRYIHGGGDPVKDTLEACRRNGKDFFVSYRMNDRHYVNDLTWPSHNAIWREHSEYWLGDSNDTPRPGSDNVRIFNYMIPEVRDYYFSILRELCTNYDVDGVELDFQRHAHFFRRENLEEGRGVMTAFIQRIKRMMEDIGRPRGKSLKLCVRIPETRAKCEAVGLDIPAWDQQRLVEMVNLSPSYNHTIELGVEEFRAALRHAKLYGEMNYVTYQAPRRTGATNRRYTTFEIYRASALNLFHRGVDGLSLFNYDYVPAAQRVPMAAGLRGITDRDYLRQSAKNYAIYAGFGTFPAKDEKTIELVIADDTSRVRFERAILRVETRRGAPAPEIEAEWNKTPLTPLAREETELFPPLAQNEAYPARAALRFFTVPLERIVPGRNTLRLANRQRTTRSCEFVSMELGLYR